MPTSKEICFDARLATCSGIGTYIRSLLPRIKDRYHLRLIVTPDILSEYSELSSFDLIFSKAGIYTAKEQLDLPLLIPKCDLFWSPHFNIPILPIRAKRRLVTIHDVFFLAFFNTLSLRQKLYARVFFQAAVKLSEHVITDSQFSLSEICKYVGPYQSKISPILLGIDHKPFALAEKKACIKVPSKYILFVGNLAAHKNISRLVQSLDLLPPDVHLVLAGKESRTEDSWREEAKKREGRVTVCGKVSPQDLAYLYQNAEMLVHPSYYEGFGLTPLEAMGAGCPVVVSKAASLPEVCGDAAFYVDPFCIKSIADGITRVRNDSALREELKAKGSQRVKLFNWDAVAEKHLQVIDRVLK